MRELHNVLLGDGANNALNLLGSKTAAGGDNLAANVLGSCGSTVQRKKDGSLQLSLSTLGLGLGDVEGQARPLAESEVDKVVDAGDGVSDEVDTPETMKC